MTCPICNDPQCNEVGRAGDYMLATCERCGEYGISPSAVHVVKGSGVGERKRAIASGWVREHQGAHINDSLARGLLTLRSPSVHERATKLLQGLARQWPDPGRIFDCSVLSQSRWLAISWSGGREEIDYLLKDYLYDALGAIKGSPRGGIAFSSGGLVDAVITPKGHELLEKLKTGNPASPVGFCAMWFDAAIKHLWADAIEPAIARAGYEPRRLDQHEHVNRIDDEILASIRRSRFVVADFTGQRGGVYFEAGYALGLGLQVIWLCNDDDLKKNIHFDVRQYNFIEWKYGEWDEAAKRIQMRIEAALGRGPIPLA